MLLTFDEAAGATAVVLPRRVVTIFEGRCVSKHELKTEEAVEQLYRNIAPDGPAEALRQAVL